MEKHGKFVIPFCETGQLPVPTACSGWSPACKSGHNNNSNNNNTNNNNNNNNNNNTNNNNNNKNKIITKGQPSAPESETTRPKA